MRFRVLGSMQVLDDAGRALSLGTRKQRRLLALLLVHANQLVTADRILWELWGPDGGARRSTLWAHVSRLRSALEPGRRKGQSSRILTREHGYVLVTDPGTIDAVDFARTAADARATLDRRPRQSAAMLRSALVLWTGRAYEDHLYDDFAQAEIARLEELRLLASEDRIEAELRFGDPAALLADLTALHRAQPYRERPVSMTMRALYRTGRQVDALACYDRFRRRIDEELAIDTSPQLQHLHEQVLRHDPDLRSSATDLSRVSAGRASRARPRSGRRGVASARGPVPPHGAVPGTSHRRAVG